VKKLLAFLVLSGAAVPAASGLETRFLGFHRVAFPSYRVSVFNPGNEAVRTLGLTAGPHWTFSQFAGLSFKALSLEWRVEASLQAAKSPGGRWETDLTFHQVFVQKDFGGGFSVLAGRSIQRWGTGYAFNPTDFAAPAKEINDPENRELRQVGRDMIKIEYFGDSYSVAVCALAPAAGGSGAWRPALRVYANIGHVDLTGVALGRPGKSWLWGGSFAVTIGSGLELHGEIAIQKGSDESYHPAAWGDWAIHEADPAGPLKSGDGTTYIQGLLGFQYTFPGNVFWVSEYYHRGQGYSASEWDGVLGYLDDLSGRQGLVPSELLLANRMWCLRVFSPNGAMRDYWMNHLRAPVTKRGAWSVTHLLNLADGGSVLIPEASWTIGGRFTFYGKSYIFLGDGRSEYGSFFQSSALEAGLRVIL
jgi:hypothetical protein